MHTDSSAPVAYTVKSFCTTFGIGRSFLYELIADGTIPVKKAGRRTLIPGDAARAWFAALPTSCAP